MPPKVSVIIPAYNVEKYIKRCIDSALSQTLSPIEILCVDDGSTDSTPEILTCYAREHENCTLLRQKNGGPSRARNAALDVAKGEYIYFLDSDDHLVSDSALEQLYARAEELQTDELFFNSQIAYSDDIAHSLLNNPPPFGSNYQRAGDYPDVLTGPEMFVRLIKNHDYKPVIWLRLFRRAFLEEHHLRFYPGIVHQDEVFSLECMSLERRVAYLNASLHERLYRPGSIMTSPDHFPSIHGDCIGMKALTDFAEEHLAGADPEFMRLYQERAGTLLYRALQFYCALPLYQRARFLLQQSAGDRRIILAQLRPGLSEMRREKFRLILRKCVPGRIRQGIKRLMGTLRG